MITDPNLTMRTYHSKFIPFFSLLLMKMVFKPSDAEDSITYIRKRRKLNERSQFDVQLYLDLQFVDNSLASEIETFDDNNPNVAHFCRAIQTQVSEYLYNLK